MDAKIRVMESDPSFPIAFLAGVVSFLSPCVLPLVPGYLSYMSGFSATGDEKSRTIPAWVAALAFVAGFSIVFVTLGATVTLLGSFVKENQLLLTRVSGALIILLGLVFVGIIKAPFLYREARFHPTPGAGVWGSVIVGGAFGFGWTPCIGPTLGVALLMAAGRASTGGPGEGALLLATYSLGLGVPFVLAGLGVSRLTTAMAWLRKHVRTVNVVGGALLIVVGMLMITDQLFRLSSWMTDSLASIGLDFWNAF